MSQDNALAKARRLSFQDMFTPKLITVLREGYALKDLRADVLAGLTVAVVALPLSMAIAIASGTTPERGLYTAIIGGFMVSLLGGSRFQIGGPAGAFIILVAAVLQRHGFEGLALATILSGLMLTGIGFLRLGNYVKFLPYPVIIGFTAGIAAIIFLTQIRELLGLTLDGPEPAALIPKLLAFGSVLYDFNPFAPVLALLTVGIIAGIKRYNPEWPSFLIAIILVSALAAFLHMPVGTIQTEFGGIPSGLPAPSLPSISLGKILAVLPDAASFALLGAIESLLSAVVADGMTGRRHRANCELVAQGIANIASGLFGGFCVTGTIARTATNVRAGGRSPVAGMMHALFLLVFMMVAAPLAAYIPLAALAGILAVVAWNMVEKETISVLFRASRADTLVLLSTFLLTIFRDLTEAICIGFGMGTLAFLNAAARAAGKSPFPPPEEDKPDNAPTEGRTMYDTGTASDRDVVVYRVPSAFFFGTAATIGMILDRIAERPQTVILDFAAVDFLDSTAAFTIEAFARKINQRGATLILTGTGPGVRKTLLAHKIHPPHVRFENILEEAIIRLRHEDRLGD
ncbi:MAG: SulP family inorganic anion transporter [Alphaproteobacteria bacterium]|nr:SulP family inorganic anion transporter [Alphaproteobacteria bacterium]